MKKNITLDDLALMVARGFNDVTSGMATKDDLVVVNARLNNLEKGQQKIHNDILNIGDKFVPRYEFDTLLMRVSRLEKKLSGK